MDSDDDMDASFYNAIDALVQQHKEKQTQLPPAAVRGSQPSSPYQALPRQPPTGQLPPGGLFQQSAQTQLAGAPLQQINGVGGTQANAAAGHPHKPPLAPHAAAWHAQPPPQRQQQQQQQPFGAGHIRPPAAAGQQQWVQHAHGVANGAGPGQDPAARLAALQAELGRSESQNKLLASNLQQRDRELAALRQQRAALERAAGQHVGGAPAPQRASFAVGEMQKALESAQKQLAFKEAEMDELRRQHADRTDRLRKAEAAVAELRQQLGQGDVPMATEQQASGSGAALRASRQRSGNTSSGAAAARSGSHKRRQSDPSAAVNLAQSAGKTGTASREVALDGGAPRPALLDPAVLAAAGSLTGSTGLVSRLMAAAGASMALLAGAAAPDSGAVPAAPAAPIALLLRARLSAAAAAAADAESRVFVAAFAQLTQQVACGMLPPCALLDAVASLVATSLAQLHNGGGPLPQQRVQLIAAGLDVAGHLLALDAGCQAAALAPLPASGSAPATSLAAAAASRPLSSRISLTGGSAAPVAALLAAGSSGVAPALPGTMMLVQRHPQVWGSLHGGADGGVLLPVVLAATLALGQQHEGVAAGALGAALELARALPADGRAVLAPLLTSGAAELFMQAPPLRLAALRLLHLLLESGELAQLCERSLAHAAAARGEPGPPTATAATGGSSGQEGAGGTVTPGRPSAGGTDPAAAGEEQQAEGGEGGRGPWVGAAAIAERLLDSFALDDGPPDAGSGGGPVRDAGGGAAVARAAMALAAMLREQRQHGVLMALLLDDACGAPGCMLAQRLVQLVEAASAPACGAGAPPPLCPARWPRGDDAAALAAQAAWQQRLRVAQEALTLLRGLLVDGTCGVATLDDLVAMSASARLTLTTLSRLARLEAPPPAPAGTPPPPPPLPLAPWARAIGSSTDHASIAEANGGGGGGGELGGLPACAVADVVYMARSCRQRVLARMQQAGMQQG